MKNRTTSGKADRPTMYEIIVEGALDRRWQEWFGGMTVTALTGSRPVPLTVIKGKVRDQSALYGILYQIMNCNLPLVSVKRLEEKEARLYKTESTHTMAHNTVK